MLISLTCHKYNREAMTTKESDSLSNSHNGSYNSCNLYYDLCAGCYEGIITVLHKIPNMEILLHSLTGMIKGSEMSTILPSTELLASRELLLRPQVSGSKVYDLSIPSLHLTKITGIQYETSHHDWRELYY